LSRTQMGSICDFLTENGLPSGMTAPQVGLSNFSSQAPPEFKCGESAYRRDSVQRLPGETPV
jgi:hypothetical protein